MNADETVSDQGNMQFNEEQFMFLRTMGHELRSPLNSILGTSEMMVNAVYGQLPDKQLKAAQRIYRNSTRLLELISSVMLYIRAQADVLELVSRPIGVRDLLEQQLTAVQEQANNKGLSLELRIHGDTPATIEGDPDHIGFIIHELLMNAIALTQAGSIGLEAASVDPEHCKFVISDTGIGITRENLANVFIPFWRGTEAKQYTPSGNGLGLSIVGELVRIMNGNVDIKSETGTVVTVTLPTHVPSITPH